MLQLHGKCLGVQTETITGGPNGSFVKTTIHILDGFATQAVGMGRDFPPADLPKAGDEVVLEVVASAFPRKGGGAGMNLTALGRVGARRLAPANSGS